MLGGWGREWQEEEDGNLWVFYKPKSLKLNIYKTSNHSESAS